MMQRKVYASQGGSAQPARRGVPLNAPAELPDAVISAAAFRARRHAQRAGRLEEVLADLRNE